MFSDFIPIIRVLKLGATEMGKQEKGRRVAFMFIHHNVVQQLKINDVELHVWA